MTGTALTLLDLHDALLLDLDGVVYVGPDPVAQAYSLALQRPPTATERAAAEKLLARYGKPAFCRALLNSNALIFVE